MGYCYSFRCVYIYNTINWVLSANFASSGDHRGTDRTWKDVYSHTTTPLQKLHRHHHHHHRNRKSHTPASPLRLKLNSILFIIILFNTLACLKLIISRVDAGCDIAHYPGPFGLQPFRYASIWISARLTTTITDTAPFSSSIHLVLPLSLVAHVFPLYTH